MSLVWVTNLSAPYRRPVWAALAARRELWVGLLGRSESNRRWSDELPDNVRRLAMRTWQRPVRSSSLYILLSAPLVQTKGCAAVILPGWENPAAWHLLLEATMRRAVTVAFYESTEQSRSIAGGPVASARRWFFHRVGAVITVGEASTAAIRQMGVPTNRIVTTHNSVDLEIFADPAHQQLDPAEQPGRGTRFAYVGQLIPRKNVEALLHALSAGPDHFTLQVIGEGPSLAKLQELASLIGVSARVNFLGYLTPTEVRDQLRTVGTLVLPSTQEVHGLAPAEAMAMGLHAVVSARAGIAPDIEGMPGVWIAEPTSDAIATAMASSSVAWSGPIADPPIRAWTPSRFADDVLQAVDIAVARRRTRDR